MTPVNLERLRLGPSEDGKIYVGIRKQKQWLEKKNITEDFIDTVIDRWAGQSERIHWKGKQWRLTLVEIDDIKTEQR